MNSLFQDPLPVSRAEHQSDEHSLYYLLFSDEEHADMEALLNLPYKEARDHAELRAMVDDARQQINDLRFVHGLPSTQFRGDSVRFVPNFLWREPLRTPLFTDASSVYDMQSDTCVVRLDEFAFELLRAQKLSTFASAVHAMFHKGSHGGIREFSVNLNMGITQLLTRDALHSLVSNRYLTDGDLERKREVEAQRSMSQGVLVHEHDVIDKDEDGRWLVLPHLPQLRIAESMRAHRRGIYQLLERAYFTANPVEAKRIVRDAYGSDVMDAFGAGGKRDEDLRLLLELVEGG